MLCRFSVGVTHFVTCFMQFYWAETLMFIKIWQPITLYIDRMNWRAGHLTTTEGTGGAFANKNCPQGRALEQFFRFPGYARVFAWGEARGWNWLTHYPKQKYPSSPSAPPIKYLSSPRYTLSNFPRNLYPVHQYKYTNYKISVNFVIMCNPWFFFKFTLYSGMKPGY